MGLSEIDCADVEYALDVMEAFNARGGAVGSKNVGDLMLTKKMAGDHAGEVTTRVQVGDVESRSVLPHVALETEGEEGLPMIREPIGQVGKDPNVDAVGGPTGRPGHES